MIYPGPKTKPFVLIHIAKSAGSSISKTIANYINEPRENYRYGSIKFVWARHIKILVPDFTNYFIFSTVRNPFARCVSLWTYSSQIRGSLPDDVSFEKWVNSGFYKELPIMVEQLGDKNGNIHTLINFIGRLENIQNDWTTICNGLEINPEDCPLLWDKKSNHRPYQEYYTKETRSIIERYFAADLRVFNYSFGD